MKTFLLLCLITTLAMVVSWVDAWLHDDHRDNNAVVEVSDLEVNSEPCMKSPKNCGYCDFKRKHILEYDFNTTDYDKWSEYLDKKCLCGRVPVQSFFQKDDEENVKQVCGNEGHRSAKNFCVSRKLFTVFHVNSTDNGNGCMVSHVVTIEQNVILACDVVKTSCLPVHYEKYTGQQTIDMPCKRDKVPSSQVIF